MRQFCFRLHKWHYKIWNKLELRQYKNDSIQSKKLPILKLPGFFPRRVGEWKSAANSNLKAFLTELSPSYIVLTLVLFSHYIEIGVILCTICSKTKQDWDLRNMTFKELSSCQVLTHKIHKDSQPKGSFHIPKENCLYSHFESNWKIGTTFNWFSI